MDSRLFLIAVFYTTARPQVGATEGKIHSPRPQAGSRLSV